MSIKPKTIWLLTVMGLSLFRVPQAAGQPNQVVVLANEKSEASLALARYYMNVRQIPEENLCLIQTSTKETISRRQYERDIRDPLLSFLKEHAHIQQSHESSGVGPGDTGPVTRHSAIQYLVPVFGVPVHIRGPLIEGAAANTMREPGLKTEASVDTELATLLMRSQASLAGPWQNPYYLFLNIPEADEHNSFLLFTSRLDGPDPDIARLRLDDLLFAERYGWLGRAFLDARGVKGNYEQGDYWILEAGHRLQREGFECVFDTQTPLWGKSFPMEDAAVYLGWYYKHMVGPFERPDSVFSRGALGYHIHSASAEKIRTREQFWTGPLLHKGAAVSAGATAEPFLHLTPNLAILTDRLCRGYNWGQSMYMALPALSWQNTVIGDPLFKPFKHSLDEQIALAEKDGIEEVAWAHARKINRLLRKGFFLEAMQYGRSKLKTHPHPVLHEKMGDLYAMNGILKDADEQYRKALQLSDTDATAARVGLRLMNVYKAQDRTAQAFELRRQLQQQITDPALRLWLDRAGTP